MEDAFSHIIRYIFGMLIFLLAISFTIALFSKGSKYNDIVVEDMGDKASVSFSVAYSEPNIYLTRAEAYSDILAGDSLVPVEVDGAVLDDYILDKARNSDSTALVALKSALTHARYKKTPVYDLDGIIVSVHYTGV